MTASAHSPQQPTAKRRIVFVGAGPLPEGNSAFAPGVANRLWNFVQPALTEGHDCLAVSIEPDAPDLSEPENLTWQDKPWRRLRARADDCLKPQRLAKIIGAFKPEILVGAGTLLASWTACQIAEEQPVWADFFGDPLAESAAKAEIAEEKFHANDQVCIWRFMVAVLLRADAFSTVSRRQADALLGQLLLAGRPQASLAPATNSEAQPGTAVPQNSISLSVPIHSTPCALEGFDWMEQKQEQEQENFKRRMFGTAAPGCDSVRVALWSGGFNAWTDPRTLVAGIELAMDQKPDLHLVVTGAELPGYLSRVYEDFRRLAAASRHSARIHPLGWLTLNEANGWLRVADLAVLADRSCAETRLGARNRLLYHAAARCPVVASRGTEVVEEMEAAQALLGFPPADASAMANSILRILSDPRFSLELGQRGYAFCRRHYIFSATAKPFLEFLRHLRRSAGYAGSAEAKSAAQWIGDYLNVNRREDEWRELEHYRSGRLSRLKKLIKGE